MTTDPHAELAERCKVNYEALTPKGKIAVAYAVAELNKIIEENRIKEREQIAAKLHR